MVESVPLDLWVIPTLIGNQKFKDNVYIEVKFLLRISKWFINTDLHLIFYGAACTAALLFSPQAQQIKNIN